MPSCDKISSALSFSVESILTYRADEFAIAITLLAYSISQKDCDCKQMKSILLAITYIGALL